MTGRHTSGRKLPAKKAARYGPLSRIGRGIKVYLLLVLAAIVGGGCASPNHFEKSPCACDFYDINTISKG